MGINKIFIIVTAIFLTIGCQTRHQSSATINNPEREYILIKTNNYHGLIKLYRERLSNNENRNTRYQLAKYYHQIGDYESSIHYLKPLIDSRPNEDELLLQAKNLMDTGDNTQAINAINQCLKLNARNGEAHNIFGVLQAQIGDFTAAQKSFDLARQLFVADDVVINNMAMLAILQQDYHTAFDYLVPLYKRGFDSPDILHNLVYVLVKLKDYEAADRIIRSKNLSSDPESLISQLAKTDPTVKKKENVANADILKNEEAIPIKVSSLAIAENPSSQVSLPHTIPTKPSSIKKNISPDLKQPSAIASNRQDIFSPVSAGLVKDLTGKIINIRFGTHPGFSRLTMETSRPIKFSAGDKSKKILHIVNLKDITPDIKLYNINNLIGKNHRDIKSFVFENLDDGTLQVNIELKKPMKLKIFRLPATEKINNRFVFDFI